ERLDDRADVIAPEEALVHQREEHATRRAPVLVHRAVARREVRRGEGDHPPKFPHPSWMLRVPTCGSATGNGRPSGNTWSGSGTPPTGIPCSSKTGTVRSWPGSALKYSLPAGAGSCSKTALGGSAPSDAVEPDVTSATRTSSSASWYLRTSIGLSITDIPKLHPNPAGG